MVGDLFFVFLCTKNDSMKKGIVLILITFISIISCTTIKEVPVEVPIIKTEYIHTHTTDTIYKDKTVYIKEKGDTVYIYDKEYVYNYKHEKDTIIQNDTTTIVVTKIEEVEVNRLKDWQQVFMILGGVFVGILLFKLIRIFKK